MTNAKADVVSVRTGRQEYAPLIAAVLLLALCIPMHAGFMLIFAAPLTAVWIIYSVVVAVRTPARLRPQVVKALVLAGAFSVIAFAHLYYAHAARTAAQQVADAVMSFKAREGRYPDRAAEAGVDEVELGRKWMLHYRQASGKPSLMYATTFTPFETYDYDFETSTWMYHPD